jgi:hypothetical protein
LDPKIKKTEALQCMEDFFFEMQDMVGFDFWK